MIYILIDKRISSLPTIIAMMMMESERALITLKVSEFFLCIISREPEPIVNYEAWLLAHSHVHSHNHRHYCMQKQKSFFLLQDIIIFLFMQTRFSLITT